MVKMSITFSKLIQNLRVIIFISCLLMLLHKIHNGSLVQNNVILTRDILQASSGIKMVSYYYSAKTNTNQVFYNRVGKAGSRSMYDVINALALRGNFTLHASSEYDIQKLSKVQEEEFVKEFENYREPFLYNRHVYFVDFTKYGYNQPIYINLIRDPLAIMVSQFYFKQENNNTRGYDLTNLSLEDCILKSHSFCTDSHSIHNLILYFCGNDENICNSENIHDLALKQAMKNVEQYYWVVGILEHFEETLEALELALPYYFKGSRVVNAITKQNRKFYATNTKKPLSEEAKQEFISRLEPDYQFYNFIRQRFFNDLSNLRKLWNI